MKDKIEIQVNPYNPAQYLACCGIFEITARFDPSAMGLWITQPNPRFHIETQLTEVALLDCLITTLTDPQRWQRDKDVTCFEVTFQLAVQNARLCLDCWYETLTQEKEIAEKSAWKMYAGQQTVEGICEEMMSVAAECVRRFPPDSLTSLLQINHGMTGRFGFDPRSSRNALDSGYSANDLKLRIATYPFTELLALIGAQHFFPARTKQSAGIDSSRGWITDERFQYGLWMTLLPINLARAAAACAAIENEAQLAALSSVRARRDKYANLTTSNPTILMR